MLESSITARAPVRAILRVVTSESTENSSYEWVQEDDPEAASSPTLSLAVPQRAFDSRGRAVDPDIGIPPQRDPDKVYISKFVPGNTYNRRKVSFSPDVFVEDSGLGRRQLVLPILDSSDETARSQNTKVRLILQGTGGVFAFGATLSDMSSQSGLREKSIHCLAPGEHIGTKFCGTGVGVYFETKDKLCFCAHVEVENGRSDSAFNDSRNSERAKVASAIRNKLEDLSTLQGWRKESIKLDTLVVLGRLLSDRRIQTAVLDGIRAFVGPYWIGRRPVYTHKHGFVVVPGQRKSLKFLDITKVLNDDIYRVPPEFDFVADEDLPPFEWSYSCSEGWKKSRFGLSPLESQEERLEWEITSPLMKATG